MNLKCIVVVKEARSKGLLKLNDSIYMTFKKGRTIWKEIRSAVVRAGSRLRSQTTKEPETTFWSHIEIFHILIVLVDT